MSLCRLVPSTNYSDNSAHIVYASNTNLTARLDGFIVRGANTDAYGGGVWLNGAAAIIADCTFFANQAYDGGAIYAGMFLGSPNNPQILNCTFVGNYAESSAGGVFNSSMDIRIVNCVFSGNTAGTGGALRCGNGSTEIANSTFSRNHATIEDWGGAIHKRGPLYIDNSILWNNTSGTSPGLDQIASFDLSVVEVNYSDVHGGEYASSGTGNINSDPKFFDDNGTDGVFGTNDDNLRLWCASPCMNTASNGLTIEDFANVDDDDLIGEDEAMPDRDRKDRVLDTTADMGAFERIPCHGDVTQNGIVDVDDLIVVIKCWGNCPQSPAFCFGDVKGPSGTGQCNGNGVIDVDDLLVVINGWGACDGGPDPIYLGMPQSLSDC